MLKFWLSNSAFYLKKIRLLSAITLLGIAGSTFSATVGSVASGWIDIDHGVSFFSTPKELCPSGFVQYESDVEITCSNNWRVYGVLAYACPPHYLPAGFPSSTWEMSHLLSFSQFMTAFPSLRAQRGNPWLRLIDDGSPPPAASR